MTSLVDYPLFSGVVVIHSLHVSRFREAHHQEFIIFKTITMMHGTMNVKYINSTFLIQNLFIWLILLCSARPSDAQNYIYNG